MEGITDIYIEVRGKQQFLDALKLLGPGTKATIVLKRKKGDTVYKFDYTGPNVRKGTIAVTQRDRYGRFQSTSLLNVYRRVSEIHLKARRLPARYFT